MRYGKSESQTRFKIYNYVETLPSLFEKLFIYLSAVVQS